VSNHIGRTADYTVPQGEGWFEFDETPGTEQLTFVMSKREIQEVTQITTAATQTAVPPPVAAPAPAPAPVTAPVVHHAAPAPVTAPPVQQAAPVAETAPATAPVATAPQTEEQEILAALNSRSLSGGRDLKMVEDNNDAYVLATDEALEKPLGFKLTLTHH
jgi:hypothetical protein